MALSTSIRKHKIVHIIPALNGGGGERFVVDLCNELAKNPNVSIYLITLFDITDEMFLSKNISQKVVVYSLGKKLGFDYTIFYKLFQLIGKIKPDIINTHLRTIEYNMLNLIFRKKIEYFHTLHNDAIVECPNNKIRAFRKWFYKKNKITPITISKASSLSFRSIYKLSNDTLIFNGRDSLTKSNSFNEVQDEFLTTYRKTPHTKVILNVGNILPTKNQLALVKVVKKHIQEDHDICLLVIGGVRDGHEDLLTDLKAICGERIFYLGTKKNVEDYLFLADAFCLSSKIEGMPITIIEAFSAGCIPICTPVGGIPNMINDLENGILGEGIDEHSIYRMINRFLTLPKETIERITQNNQILFSQKFDISLCAENYLKLYKC